MPVVVQEVGPMLLRRDRIPLNRLIQMAVEGYQADELILKFLSVRWCRWDRSVFYLFIDIKNTPGNAWYLSLYL